MIVLWLLALGSCPLLLTYILLCDLLCDSSDPAEQLQAAEQLQESFGPEMSRKCPRLCPRKWGGLRALGGRGWLTPAKFGVC